MLVVPGSQSDSTKPAVLGRRIASTDGASEKPFWLLIPINLKVVMTGMLQDLRYGFRSMRRNLGFTIVILITLILGISSTTTIFSVINAVLLRPLPYRDAGRIVSITTDPNDDAAGTSVEHYKLWQANSSSFEEMAVYYRNLSWSRVTLTFGDEPELAQAGFTSASFFSVMGMSPILGRVFTNQEEAERQRVAVLSAPLWKRQFGGATDVLGKTLQLDGQSFQIIGVMPETFQLPAKETQLWVPITTNRYWLDRLVPDPTRNQNFYWRWNVIARLKPGVAPAMAQVEVDALTKNLEDPILISERGISVFPLQLAFKPTVKLSLIILMGVVSFVLLIACMNVANLLLARGIMREREIAIRMALGAGRGRIVRQLLTETLLLALVAGGFAIILVEIGIKVLISFGPQNIPRLEQVRVDGWVLGFTILVSVIAATLSGLLPAWKISQGNITQALQAEGRSMAGSFARRRTTALLIGLEFALSMVLLTGAGLLIRSFTNVQRLDLGFRPEQVVTLNIAMPAGRPLAQRLALYDQFRERVGALPETQSVGGIKELFNLQDLRPSSLRSVEGHEPEPPRRAAPLLWTTVSGDFFSAIGVPLLKGRNFSDEDGQTSPPVAIIDENTAQRFWPGENPIGNRFKGYDPRGQNDDWITVIGVVGNMHLEGVEKQPVPHLFEWYKQAANNSLTPNIIVRSTGEPSKIVGNLRATIHAVEPTAIITSVTTMKSELDRQMAPRLFQTWLIGLFSVIALVLVSVGIYGLMHYTVVQRTHEIGIRMALGAQARTILAMFIRQGMSMAGLGLIAGLAGSFCASQLITSMLFGVAPTDPITFAAVIALLLSVATAATSIPAWRAATVDPSIALRD
jgi:predicted permease